MLRRYGPSDWHNAHITYRTEVDDLIDIDNVDSSGNYPTGLALFRNAAETMHQLVLEARSAGKRLRAIGAGWALSDINITDGFLLNTKPLNSRFSLGDRFFEASVPAAVRPRIILAQCGNQIAELNNVLELTPPAGVPLSLRAAGIGNGQTIAGAVSGNTHGSQVNFGAMNDFVVGIHLVTGAGKPLWIERASRPIFNGQLATEIGAQAVRDDELFNAAVVSFGTFGIIAALAIETADRYHLEFGPIVDRSWDQMKARLDTFDPAVPPNLYHHEFIFDPYSKRTMETSARKIAWAPGHPTPKPRWIVRTDSGIAPGAKTAELLAALPAPASLKTKLSYDQYRKLALLNKVRGTPGQIYTSSIYYLEGYAEAAFGVSITDASRMLDVSRNVILDMGLPAISQVRFVAPTQATLGFTQHGPRTTVFEYGLINNASFPKFEQKMDAAMRAAGIRYTMHWSKNSGISAEKVRHMYGEARVTRWIEARRRVFKNDRALMKVFENEALVRANLHG
ncbi:MAG TPA: FAD-binding protein [Allosphingosinicella sp.]|nr:FAD-binding protein [Allosphingosinicella sp.]